MKRREFIAGLATAATAFSARNAAAHPVKQVPDYNLPEELLPRAVPIAGSFVPYEIHVNPDEFALYWTLPDNRALRYMVGIGRPGLYEAGEFYVGAKKEWPSWTPTPGMLRREPQLYSKWKCHIPAGSMAVF